MPTAALSAREEWRLHYLLPVVAALGYATSVIHIYGIGAYYAPIMKAFGWTRTEAAWGLTISTMVQAVLAIPIGILVDRVGPRWFGVVGVLLTTGAFSLLTTASGSLWQWYGLWAVLAAATLPVQATIWTSAVATRFTASRGIAFALALCGASLAQTIFPPLGTWLIGEYGWRTAFLLQGGLWALISFPPILFFFRSAKDDRTKRPAVETPIDPVHFNGTSLLDGLRSSIYLRLFLTALLFTLSIIALVVNFIDILVDRGAERQTAANIAALIGFASIAGRLGTGMLLDRCRGSVVGAIAFLLPAAGCLCLLGAGGNHLVQSAAAILIGLTLGAEVDVLAFLTSRYFGIKAFGGLYGGLMVALSIGTSLGPLAAAKMFDVMGGFAPYLWICVGLLLLASLCLASLPRPTLARA